MVIFILLIFASFTGIIDGAKLSLVENEQIQQICGNVMQGKVMRGSKLEIRDAPWAVSVDVIRGDGLMHCTGTLVSSRHVITARHCFVNDFQNNQYTYVANEQSIDFSNCQGLDFVVPRGMDYANVHFATQCTSVREHQFRREARDSVHREGGSSRALCGRKHRRLPKRRLRDHRVGQRRPLLRGNLSGLSGLSVSFLLFFYLISNPLSDDSVGLRDGDILRLYGFGYDPDDTGVPTGVLRYEDSRIVSAGCNFPKYVCSQSLNGNQLACRGDSGGGVVMKINGRSTAIAVLSRGVDCKLTLQMYQTDYLAPVINYKGAICDYTGLCDIRGFSRKHEVTQLFGTEERTIVKQQGKTAGRTVSIPFIFFFTTFLLNNS